MEKAKITCTDLAVVGHARTELEAAKFEQMEWELVQQKVKSDIQAVQVYRSKLECHESLVYHAKLEHQRRRRVHARESIGTMFKGTAPQFQFCENVDKVLSAVSQLRREYRLQQPVLVLVVVNWASPSIVRDEHLALQLQALQQLVNLDDADSMGLVLMPVWERAKGSLYKSENLLLKSLSEKDTNTDEKASLSFEDPQ